VCVRVHRSLGKGTPAPLDAPIFLVKEGPYHWVRNPMDLAVLAMVIGQAILFRSFLLVGYVLLVWGVVHLFVVLVEEPSLRHQFGESYETYLRMVARWLPLFLHRGCANTTNEKGRHVDARFNSNGRLIDHDDVSFHDPSDQ
jgi:protein-S-isoprenylcysteine O-methyltransferase Ste14